MITTIRRTAPALAPVAPEVVTPRTAAQLREVVRLLSVHQPTLRMTNGTRSRMAAHAAAGSAVALAPLLRLLPFAPQGAEEITRGEYAVRVNAIAGRYGYAWTGDDGQDENGRAIPTIPGARPESDPLPKGPVKIPGARPEQSIPAPCEPCFGQGGETVISNAGRGRIRKTFVPCKRCNGKGAI